jgi:hypothetical protein
MSLNFDVNSNLSLVRRFHTMEKLQKCVNFILTDPVFFCDQLYPQDLANAMGLNRNQILVPTFIVCCETKKELCIYFEPLYSHDLVTFNSTCNSYRQ